MSDPVRCPVCDQADQVEKVSTIYLLGIEAKRASTRADAQSQGSAASTGGLALNKLTAAELRALSQRLAPPASGKELPTRLIHPNLVVMVFSLGAPVFLYGILTSQPAMLLPALIILALFYAVYFWKRKTIIARFESRLAAQQAASQRIQHAIQRWMRLYYCAREDGVFKPGEDQIIPADQMPAYLFEE